MEYGECRVCKYFNGLGDNTMFQSMGVCALNGEATGKNSSCGQFKMDRAKVEAIGEKVVEIYFSRNVTAAEALRLAKED